LERLNYLVTFMPAGVEPKLGPTPLAWAGFMNITSPLTPTRSPQGGYDLGQLRAIQNWSCVTAQCRAAWRKSPAFRRFPRQYQIEVSSLRMRQLGVTLQMVLDGRAPEQPHVGGKIIEETAWNSSYAASGW